MSYSLAAAAPNIAPTEFHYKVNLKIDSNCLRLPLKRSISRRFIISYHLVLSEFEIIRNPNAKVQGYIYFFTIGIRLSLAPIRYIIFSLKINTVKKYQKISSDIQYDNIYQKAPVTMSLISGFKDIRVAPPIPNIRLRAAPKFIIG